LALIDIFDRFGTNFRGKRQNAFFDAVRAGDIPNIQYYVDRKGVDVEAFDTNGLNALQQSLNLKRFDVVNHLLGRGVNVSVVTRDQKSQSTLQLVIQSGNSDIVTRVLNALKNQYKDNPAGLHTLLSYRNAAGQNAIDNAKDANDSVRADQLQHLLIEARVATRDAKYFIEAAAAGDVVELQRHIEARHHSVDVRYSNDQTALGAAILSNQEKAVALLLGANADPEIPAKGTTPALTLAITGNQSPIYSALIAALETKHVKNPVAMMQSVMASGALAVAKDKHLVEAGNALQAAMDKAAHNIISTHYDLVVAMEPQKALAFSITSGNLDLCKYTLAQTQQAFLQNPEQLETILNDSDLKKTVASAGGPIIALFDQSAQVAKQKAIETRLTRGSADDFFNAVEDGRVEEVRAFIEGKKVDINATKGKNKWNALLLAANKGHGEIVTMLLDAGINPDSRSIPQQNVSALWLAATNKCDAVAIKLALALKQHYTSSPQKLLASLSHFDADGHFPLALVYKNGGSELKNTLAHIITEAAEPFATAHSEIDTKLTNGLTRLQFAAAIGHAELARLEVERLNQLHEEAPDELFKALTAKDSFGRTAMDMAQAVGAAEVIAMLRPVIQETQAQITRDAAQLKEDRALLEAVSSGSAKDVKKLLDRGICDVNARNRKNRATGLYTAAYYAKLDKMQLLIAAGANPDARTDKNYSPLNAALLSHDEQAAALIVPALETYYADNGPALLAALSTSDQHGKTPLERARKEEYARCANLIEDAIAKSVARMDLPQISVVFNAKNPYMRNVRNDPQLFGKVIERLSEFPEKLGAMLGADATLMMYIVEHDKTAAARKIMQALKGHPEQIRQVLGVVDAKHGTPLHYALEKERNHLLSIFAEGGVIPNALFNGKTATAFSLDKDLIDVFLNFVSCGGEVEPGQKADNIKYLKQAVVAQVEESKRDEAYKALVATVHKVKYVPKESNEREFGAYIKMMTMIDEIATNCDPRHLTQNPDGSFYISPLMTAIIKNTPGDWSKMANDLRQTQVKMEAETGVDETQVFSITACRNVKDMMASVVTLMGLPLIPITLGELVDEVALTDQEIDRLVEASIPEVSKLMLAGIPISGNHHLNMKGMNLGLILEYSNNWHQNLELLQSNTREIMPEGEWFPILKAGNEVPITAGAMTGGKIVNLSTTQMLKDEARKMGNCISSHYTSKGMAGTSHLFSMVDATGKPRADLELKLARKGYTHDETKKISIPGTDKELYVAQFEGPVSESRRVPPEAKDGFKYLKEKIESGAIEIQISNIGRTTRPKTIKKGSPLYEAIGTYRPDEKKWENNYQAILHFTAANKRTKFLVPSSYKNPDKIDPTRYKMPVEAFLEDSGLANVLWTKFCEIKPELSNQFMRVEFRGRQRATKEILGKMDGMEVTKEFLAQLRERGLEHLANVLAISTTKIQDPPQPTIERK